MHQEETGEGIPAGFLFVGGQLRVDTRGSLDSHRRLGQTLDRLSQVRNFAILVGAGASAHLGSPPIRDLTPSEIEGLVVAAGLELTTNERVVLAALAREPKADLEDVLTTLQAALSFGRRSGSSTLRAGNAETNVMELDSLRRKLNKALVVGCDLPKVADSSGPSEDTQAGVDPLLEHRELLSRVLRTRREELPRVRIFTTNYDLLVEKTLDQMGVPYFDGFQGTVQRTFHPESFGYELYQDASGDERLSRVSSSYSLFKLHGSINWRSVASPLGGGLSVVVQRPTAEDSEDLALIYPTPQKEGEVLGYPYSEVFRWFGLTIRQPETALLVLGYGFADEHVNRLLVQALASNPTLHLFVVSPFAPLGDQSKLFDSALVGGPKPENVPTLSGPGRLTVLARESDARISVLTGPAAQFVHFSRFVFPNPGDATPRNEVHPSSSLLDALLEGNADDGAASDDGAPPDD